VAVHLNVTVVPGPYNGYIQVYPKNSPSTSSTMNYKAGVNLANAITVKTLFDIGSADITVDAIREVNVLADVQGYYYPAKSRFVSQGYDVFTSSDTNLIDTNSRESVSNYTSSQPTITVEEGDDVFISATLTVNPAADGNVELDFAPCRLTAGSTTVLDVEESFVANHEACYTGVTTADYIVVPFTAVYANQPAGTWDYAICAHKDAQLSCDSGQNYRAYTQNITVIRLK